jgi:hypothetical protein
MTMSPLAEDGYVGKFEELYCVALVDDLPEYDLRKGDIGVIVHLNTPSDFIVEFTAEHGRMSALLDLNIEWLRIPSREDAKHSRKLAPNEHHGWVQRHPKVATSSS